MKGKRISRQKLNNAIKELPIPVQEHCKRCKSIASFVVERIKDEDWFLDAKLNAESIVSAVYLHDIGKCRIPKDNLYAVHNAAASKKKIYMSHVNEGIQLVEVVSDIKFDEFGDRAFETYVYNAISEHHENVDGSGFPNGKKGDEISVTGKITAIANTVDNLLFVGNSDDINADEVLKELKNLSGKTLDKKLVSVILSEKEAFKNFIGYIDTSNKNKRKNDNYGLQFIFSPIKNVREDTVFGYYAEFVINDPYYGIVKPEVFLPVSEKTGQISRLEKISFERLCILTEKLKDKVEILPNFTLRLSASCFEKKTFIKELEKTAAKCGINRGKICFVIDESEISENDGNFSEAVTQLREFGFRVAVRLIGEGATFLSSLDSVILDGLYIDGKYSKRIADNSKTFKIASGILDIAGGLQIPVTFGGVDEKYIESELLRMKTNYAFGALYGEPISEKALISRLSNPVGGSKR